MKKKLQMTLMVALAVVGLAGAMISPALAADGVNLQGSLEKSQGQGTPTELFGSGSVVTTIINTLLFLIGVVSVIMIIYGGIQYATSAGDSGKVSNAKNTILYAVVGLIVAILAYALVNFVVSTFKKE